MTLKSLKLTPLIVAQLARVEAVAGRVPNAEEPLSVLEQEKLSLAELVFEEVQRQQVQQRVRRLPDKARAVPVVLEVALQRKRRPA